VNLVLKFVIGFGIGLVVSQFGVAGEKLESGREESVESAVRSELSKRFARASIEFLPGSTFPAEENGKSVIRVRILSETGTGTADYSVGFSDGSSSIGQARFTAMVPTFVASKRIRPGDRLARGDFQIQSINIAQGLAYQYRGVMLSANETIDGLQARQTILEGQYPLSSGVEKVPDIRRGDTVQVKILSGEIQLSTMATVQEPGYLNQNVRILTQKSKKELVGMLKEGGVVEVKL
jgi:flagella basal body P-ring formation protein FlgA